MQYEIFCSVEKCETMYISLCTMDTYKELPPPPPHLLRSVSSFHLT
jgi:hypothetical protein